MPFPFWSKIRIGTQASDIGVSPPWSLPAPSSNDALSKAQIQYAFTWNGDDELSIDFPWRTVTSLGAGNDRYDDLTPWGSYLGLNPQTLRVSYSQVYGDAGDDTLVGGFGRDVLKGGSGNDYLYGGDNDDALFGNGHSLRGVLSEPLSLYAFNPHVRGGSFLDLHRSLNVQLDWSIGSNYLDGGDGNDFLSGGRDFDTFLLGPGNNIVAPDSFTFDPQSYDPTPDLVLDFKPQSDKLFTLTALYSDWQKPAQYATALDAFFRIDQNGNDVDIGYDPDGDPSTGGHQHFVTLQDVNAGELSNHNFIGYTANSLNTISALNMSLGSFFSDHIVIDDAYESRAPIYTLSGDDDVSFDLTLPSMYGVPIDLGEGNDTGSGSAANDMIRGGQGDDQQFGLGGDDVLIGGFGAALKFFGSGEQLPYGPGADSLDGGDGNDVLHSDGGVPVLTGGLGVDTFIYASPGAWPGLFHARITDFTPKSGLEPDNLILTGLHHGAAELSFQLDLDANATDILIDVDGAGDAAAVLAVRLNDLLIASLDDINIVGYGTESTAIGRLHAYIGTRGDDDLVALVGDWTTTLHGGDDTFDGSAATDRQLVYACDGADSLVGGFNHDFLDGGSGDDTVRGGEGNDVLVGDGEDRSFDPLDPSASMPVIGGADLLDGGDGDDFFIPGQGFDTISGGSGIDSTLFGGRDTLGDLFTDFTPGFLGDRMMFANVFDLAPGLYFPSSYVTATQIGSDTHLFGDFDGIGFGDDSVELLAILEDFTASSLLIDIQLVIGDPYEPNNAPTADDAVGTTLKDTVLPGALPRALDIDGDRVTYSLALAPSDGFAMVGPNGLYLYWPNPGYVGADSFEYAVDDGKGGVNTYTTTLDVLQPNRAPTSVNAIVAATEDAPLAGGLPAAVDLDGDPVTYSLAAPATHGAAVVQPNGAFTYTPTPDYFGADQFKFTVADGNGGSNTYDANVTVANVNDAPTSTNTNLATNEDLPLAGNLPAAVDVDGDPVGYTLQAPATHGTAVVQPNGAFTYTPTPDYFGADQFKFTVADGNGGSNTYDANLSIASVNDLPTASNAAFGATEDVLLEDMLPAASDADGDPVGYSLATQAAHGTAAIDPDGSFTYLGAPDFFGADSFEYRVSDGNGGSNVYLASIDVASVVDTITGSAESDTLVDDSNGPAQINGLGGNDTLTGNSHDDTLDGGAGFDIASYDGPIADYTIGTGLIPSGALIKALDHGAGVGTTRSAPITKDATSSHVVNDTVGADGTDMLTDIERVEFSDMSVNLMVQAAAASIPQPVLDRIAELYVGFFGRVPASDGLEYWIGQYKSGQSIDQIAQAFYEIGSGPALREFTGYWDFANDAPLSDEAYVAIVYRNVLGREGLSGGINFWKALLTDGSHSRGSLVSVILDSAHTFKGDPKWGWVADLLDDRVTISKDVAVNWGLNYASTPGEAITKGMAIVGSVIETPNPDPALEHIPIKTFDFDTAIELVGIDPADIDIV